MTLLALLFAATIVQIDVVALNFLAGTVIPLLTALVTTRVASPGLKAVVTLLLSAVAGGVAVAIEANGTIELETWIVSIGCTWLLAIASYYGLWKPTTVAPKVQEKTATFGVGRRE